VGDELPAFEHNERTDVLASHEGGDIADRPSPARIAERQLARLDGLLCEGQFSSPLCAFAMASA
jgi:hypothetical protein